MNSGDIASGDYQLSAPKVPAEERFLPKEASILVVDDVAANLHLLAGLLKERGYRVRPVPSGKLALLAARKAPPDLILLDVNMPEMDGYEVCQQLKADSDLRDIPVVFVSARNENLDKIKGFAVGGVDYITKPFQMEEVQARVETQLRFRRVQIELAEDVDALKDALKDALAYAEKVVDTVREPLLILGGDLRVMSANRAFYQTFKVSAAETLNRLVYNLGDNQWDIPRLRTLLEEILPHSTFFDGFEVEQAFADIGRKVMLLNARRFLQGHRQTELILLAFEDVTERRRAEEERRVIETRFTSLVKNIQDHAIFTLDVDGRITSWNVEAERILGYPAAEIIGRPFSMLFTAEDLQNDLPGWQLREAKEAGRAEDGRWQVRKGGERFWASGVVTPTHDDDGRHSGFSKILRDRTEQKRAEEDLQRAHEAAETEVRIRTAELRTANEGLQKEIEDRKLAERRLRAQHATTKLLAESPNLEAAVPQIIEAVCESMEWAWAAVWMPDAPSKRMKLEQFWHSPSANLNEFLTLCGEKTFAHGEGLLGGVWATGEPVWAPDVMQNESFFGKHAAGQAGLHGAFIFPILLGREVLGVIEFLSQRIEQPDEKIFGMVTAIGSQIGQFIERKQTELALAKEREFLKAVLENAQDLIIACDSHGVLVLSNRVARDFHDAGDRQLPADEWAAEFDVFKADGKSRLAKEEIPLYRALRGESVRDVEFVLHPKGGEARTLRATGRAITDAEGRQLGAVLVMHDVTERNLLEQQLHQAQKMEAFGQLAGGVAHDFNNLLTIISGYGELLLASAGPHGHDRELIQEICNAGARATLLTRQLLAFSRKQVVEPKVLDLNAVVAGAETMLARLIGEDFALTTVLLPGLDRVKADPGQLEQVVMNLIVNARDAMPEGGRITIETANIELDESVEAAHTDVKPGRYVLLSVSDDGCGMSDEVKRHIFEPFFTTKQVGKGTGLGLATVFGIIKQSGGHVRVYSEVGRGTTFKIYLPFAEEVVAAAQTKVGPAPTPAGAETILVVEDEKAVRAMTRLALQSNGYFLLEAGDGMEAIRLCEQHQGPIHLLVSDVVMPQIGGRRLAERLTALHPEMRVLFVSGYTDDAVVRHGVLQAEVAFLQKPFTLEALRRKVRALLDSVN